MSNKSKDPALLLYVKDFTTGTQDMSVCEVGAYMRLLCYQHQHPEGIPDDTARMMRITGVMDRDQWTGIWSVIQVKFIAITGDKMVNHLVNERLSKEMTKRSTSRPKKLAAACLAGLISSNKMTAPQAKKIKQNFDIQDFISFSDEEMKEKIKIWFYKEKEKMVNHLVNNIVNVNANVNKEEKGGMGEKEEDHISTVMDEIRGMVSTPVSFDTVHARIHSALIRSGYAWRSVDNQACDSLVDKIRFTLQQTSGIAPTDDDIYDIFNQIRQSSNWWVKKKFSLSNLDEKYNEIIQDLRSSAEEKSPESVSHIFSVV